MSVEQTEAAKKRQAIETRGAWFSYVTGASFCKNLRSTKLQPQLRGVYTNSTIWLI